MIPRALYFASTALFVVILGCLIQIFLLRVGSNLFTHQNLASIGAALSARDFILLGTLPILSVALALEWHLVGWEASSLKKVLSGPSASVRSDIFYTFLQCTGLGNILGIIFSFALAMRCQLYVEQKFGFHALKDIPLALGFLLQVGIGSFSLYWIHYLMHRPIFWDLHKVHHNAETMSILNNFRVHPATTAVRVFVEAIPAAILGIPAPAVLAYAGVSGFIVLMQHADLDWQLTWIEKYFLIGARAHRVHHSNDPKHYRKNLGILVFWDWLFGSLYIPDAQESFTIGMPDANRIQGHPLKELIESYKSWLLHLKNLIFLRG